MRAVILTSARSGSTSLFHLIEEHLTNNFTTVSEPFNGYWRGPAGLNTYDVDFFENKLNVFVKTFVSELQRPKTFWENEDGYWNWFFNYFDKVIILDRVNKDLQSESLTYHLKKGDRSSWQKKQFYNLSNINKEDINQTKDVLIKDSQKMHSFVDMGYPIVYFEDIFIKKNKQPLIKVFDYLNIELNDELYDKYVLSDKFKIRLGEGESIIRSII